MAHSIESRVPFLTTRLTEFIMSLPDEHLISSDGTRKAVFREAMRGIVPDCVLERKDKIGFSPPEHQWMVSLRPWVEKMLKSETANRIPALNGRALLAEWNAGLAGHRPLEYTAWQWINLIRWAELYEVEF